jgi:hypothetical protein
MKRTVLFLLAGILTILVVECNRTTPVSPNQTITLMPGPGAFGLGYMKGLSKSTANAAVKSGANVNFDLGSIKGSTAFYFLLYNIGSTPITNVTLSTADTQFEVYPSAMDTLIPGGDVGMLPVVKVSAIHGTALDGYGFRPLMPRGKNSGKLLVTGKTKTRNGADTSVALVADLTLNTLVMDIVLKCGQTTIPLVEPLAGMGYIFDNFVVSLMRGYGSDISGDSVSIINTGNVPVALKIEYFSYSDVNAKDSFMFSLDTLQKAVVPRTIYDSKYKIETLPVVCLDGHNTVTDQDRLPLQANGKSYFFIEPFNSSSTIPNQDSLNLQPFISLANAATCADSANLLYLIDSSVVFWDRQGACPDNSYAYTLYSVHSVDSVLCRRNDSVAGPQEQCIDQKYHDLLDTIVANLSATDLGMDSAHQVNPIPLQ